MAQVRPRFDLAELGAREERGEGRVYGSAIVAADEEPVLPSDGFATKRKLAHVVVNRKAAILDELRKANALIARVANASRDRRVVENRRRFGGHTTRRTHRRCGAISSRASSLSFVAAHQRPRALFERVIP